MSTARSSQPPNVLVVGAGPTGLMLACELARHGALVRIVDENERGSERSKAIGVHARTLEIFEHLGVAAEALALGRPIHGLNVYAEAGGPGPAGAHGSKRIVHIDFDDVDTPYPFILSLPQSDTERILGDLARRLGVTVERSVRLVGIAQDAGSVTARLEHPPGGGAVEEATFAFLVGCDGAHSVTRKTLGVPFEGAPYDEDFVLADVELAWDRPDDESHVFLSPDGAMVTLPLPTSHTPGAPGRWRIIADLPKLPAGESPSEPTLARVQTLMESRGARDAVIEKALWTANFRIHRRMVPSYRRGRVFLAGDAAHIHSPVGGQGMNTGIQDAYNLAWKLGLTLAGAAHPSLLDSYHLERHPVAAATLQGTDLATRVVTLRGTVTREIRNRLGGLLSGIEAVQKRLVRGAAELDLSYRKSPLVGQDRSALLRTHLVFDPAKETPSVGDWMDFGAAPGPGERAPDVEFGAPAWPRRIFELFHGEGHTLLLFDGGAPTEGGYENLASIATAITSRYARHITAHVVVPREKPPEGLDWTGSVLCDPTSALHARYGAGAECLYLIRPDGYVGYRAQPADGEKLARYLERIFV